MPYDVIAEASMMPETAVAFIKKNVGQVWTPEHLIPLRDEVRENHGAKLGAVFDVLSNRFDRNANWFGAFQAAAEMAVIVEVGGNALPAKDRAIPRNLWEHLLVRRLN